MSLGVSQSGPQRVGVFAHRWGGGQPTGMGRVYLGLASGLASLLFAGDEGAGAPGPRSARAGTDAGGRSWAVTLTSAAEPDAGDRLPAGLGWQPLRGPRRVRLAAWRAVGRPRIDGPLGHPALVYSLHPFVPVPTSAPLVSFVVDTIPLDHPDWYRRFERWGFAGGYGQLRHSARVITSSQEVAGRLLRPELGLGIDPDRLAVVPLGVDDRFRRPVPSSTIAAVGARHGVEPGGYFVAVGQVSTRKNLAVVLEGLALLPPSGGVELLVAGPDATGAEEVRALAHRLGLASRVRFAGFVADADLPALLTGARALLHPSTEEGFGLTPLEAMAAGVPAVVAAAGSLPEVVGDAAPLLDPRDPSAWAEVMSRLREDETWHGSLVAAGAARVGPRTWATHAAGVLDVWAEVLARR